MIDIHTHILFGVDDGASSIDQSIMMIKKEIESGVKNIILTPHFRNHLFEKRSKEIENNFHQLISLVKKLNLDVNLYLGREIYYNQLTLDMLKKGHFHTMNNSSYVLLEFSYNDNIDISEIVYNFSLFGYKVIIAHIERYNYLSVEDIMDLKNTGALIQVNASSIVGADGYKTKRKVLKLFNNNLVDFVSSDIHFDRINYFKKAYQFINKKYGEQYSQEIFNNSIIIDKKGEENYGEYN